MIKIENLSFRFNEERQPLFSEVTFELALGEVCLLVGPTGCGKSTLLKAFNGLNPFFTGGTLGGRITIDQKAVTGKRPQQLAHLVAYVDQQAEASFVTETVAEEIAFALEQLGTPVDEMIGRIRTIAADLEIEHLLHRPVTELSGGQQQRVSIAAALVTGAQVLVLDEPTSELDASGAASLVRIIRELATKRGVTVLVAEHRIDRLLGVADSVLLFSRDGEVRKLDPQAAAQEIRGSIGGGSPLIDLASTMRWNPVPLTVDSARALWGQRPGTVSPRATASSGAEKLLSANNLTAERIGKQVVSVPSLSLRAGSITGVIGPNGAGKSSLLWRLAGLLVGRGQVQLPDGAFPTELKPSKLLTQVALVPQSASDLLVLSSVAEELQASDAFAGAESGTTERLLADFVGAVDLQRHPRDLSAGQQLGLALALQLAKDAKVLLLDEPTRGLDYFAKESLRSVLARLAAAGKAIVVATHDLDFIAGIADECLVLDRGKVREQGPSSAVLAKLGADAPVVWQVTKSAISVGEVTP